MNNIILLVNETKFLLPIIALLGLSIIVSLVAKTLKLGFVPTFVIDIIIGIALKQIFFNETYINEYGSMTEIMYTIGFILIMFISGFDNNVFSKDIILNSEQKMGINIKRKVVLLLCFVYICSLITSLFFMNNYENIVGGTALLTIVISSTFAGVVVPMVKEEHLSKTIFGNFIIYFSTISELASIVLLTIFMFIIEFELVRMLAYLGLILLFILIYFLNKVLNKSSKRITSGLTHMPVRIVFVILSGCVVLCEVAGGEYVLGAFLFGMFLRKIDFSEHTIEKIESICFGLFAPIFFIIIGTKINIRMFIENPRWLLTVLLLVVAFVISKAPLIYLKKWYNGKTTMIAMSLTCCTLVVGLTASHLGEVHHIISYEFAQCIISASIITCIITSIMYESFFPYYLRKIKKQEKEIKCDYGSEGIA